jgi:hypothetical protein
MDDFGMDFGMDEFWSEADFILQDIVRTIVNVMGAEIGITLFMRGMVVSGTMVSEAAYLATLTDFFQNQVRSGLKDMDAEIADTIINALDFRDLAETSVPDFDDEDPSDDDDFGGFPEPIRFLHLREVTVLTPQPSLGFETAIVPTMRVRLTSIDGWLLGQAVANDGPDQPPAEVLH